MGALFTHFPVTRFFSLLPAFFTSRNSSLPLFIRFLLPFFTVTFVNANKWKGSKVKLGAKAMGRVSNDDMADWTKAWELFPGDVAYVWHGGLRSVEQAQGLEQAGFVIRSQIIWDKTRLVISRG